MQILTMEITSALIEEGFRTGNTIRAMAVTKGLPRDAKLINANLSAHGNLELHFQSEKSGGADKHINIELTTLGDA